MVEEFRILTAESITHKTKGTILFRKVNYKSKIKEKA